MFDFIVFNLLDPFLSLCQFANIPQILKAQILRIGHIYLHNLHGTL